MKKFNETELRKTSSKLGFLLIFYFLLNVIISIFTLDVAKGFLLGKLNLNISENMLVDTVSSISNILLIFVLFFFFYVSKKEISINNIHFVNKQVNILPLILIGFLVIEIADIVTNYAMGICKFIGVKSTSPEFIVEKTTLGIFLSVINFSLVPALTEEFIFRGIVLNSARPYGKTFAIFSSAFLFGLVHGNLEQFVFAFITGMFFSYVTLLTESLLPSVIIHFLNNFMADILNIFQDKENILTIILIFKSFVGLLGLACLFYYWLKSISSIRKVFKTKCPKKKFNIAFIDKFNAFLFNPGMTLFVLLALFLLYTSFKGK